MKRSLILIFTCATLSMVLDLYLSNRAESLAAGAINEHSPICHINEQFNCDNILASPYSHFAGTHVSNWGFSTHFFIALLSLILLTGWAENRWNLLVTLWGFSILSAVASIVMLSISFFILKHFCVLCCILYILSFIIIFSLFFIEKAPLIFSEIKKIPLTYLSSVVVAWIGISFLPHMIFIKFNNTKSSEKIVEAHFQDWLDSSEQIIDQNPLLSSEPEKTNIIIIEFADFLCHHCRNIHHTLKIFKASHPDVQINYFSFPLDQCQGKTASCFLTRAVYCSEKQKQGWAMQDIIYKNQKSFLSISKDEKALEELKLVSGSLNIDWTHLQDCLSSPSAFEAQQQQIQAGNHLKVESTPTLFVNGRKMNHRYALKTLKAIYSYLNQSNHSAQ